MRLCTRARQRNLEMTIRFWVIAGLTILVPAQGVLADNSVQTGPRRPVINESAIDSIRQVYPNGSPVSNAQQEILGRFLTSFESSPSLAADYGEVRLSVANKPNSPAKIRAVKLPKDMQRRLNFLDAVVLASVSGNRLFDDVTGELFPYGLSTAPDLPNGLKYRTDASLKAVRQKLKFSDRELLLTRAIPLRILTVYPGLFSEEELDSPSNFRFVNRNKVTVSGVEDLRAPWIDLFLSKQKITREQIEAIRDRVDLKTAAIQKLSLLD